MDLEGTTPETPTEDRAATADDTVDENIDNVAGGIDDKNTSEDSSEGAHDVQLKSGDKVGIVFQFV
ncbi:MAG: hypothetical protein ACO3O8_04645 [Pelagibacteraceae bacterium]